MTLETLDKDDVFALSAFDQMWAIRCFEKKCVELSETNPPIAVGSIHPCAGQEAIPVGALAALRDTDRVIATYRGHGWALAADISPFELMSELCHRDAGISGGRGGSLYVVSPHRRFMGENSIVGAGAPIGAGVAMALKNRGDGDLIVVSVGDGAMSQGALHEGIVFAAAYSLPVIFICENNGWSEMTPISSMLNFERLSRRAHGYGIPGATIDGGDPVAVRNSIAAAAERVRGGNGPCLLEFTAPRLWGHYNRDIEHYRSKADKEKANSADPIGRLRASLVSRGVVTQSDLDQRAARILEETENLARQIADLPASNTEDARRHIYTDTRTLPAAQALPSTSVELTYVQAINAALQDELESRPELMVYGEDVGVAGGVLGATRNLQKQFGKSRVFDTPIAESAIIGSAIGASMMGLRPVVEIMWGDFMLVGIDQLINHAANVAYLSRGQACAPIVVRTQQGAAPGSCAQHSQCLEAILAHTPGLRVGLPATAGDAYSMLRAAVASDDPTIILEARTLYQTKEFIDRGGDIAPASGARVRRDGKDVGIIAWGTTVQQSLAAAEALGKQGIDAGVLDLRWLSPLDDESIRTFVARSNGRVVVAHEANVTGGFGAEIAARVQEQCWSDLRAPVARVGAPDIRVPASPALQSALMPSANKIENAARQLVHGKQS